MLIAFVDLQTPYCLGLKLGFSDCNGHETRLRLVGLASLIVWARPESFCFLIHFYSFHLVAIADYTLVDLRK
jgi:hypothetical protein